MKSNREENMRNFLNFFNTASNHVFKIQPSDMVEEGYHRYSYSVTHFKGSTPTIRLRFLNT